MFTKSEITKKRGEIPQQLPLIEVISSGDKVRQKRKWVIIAIILTIGLSSFFSLFRFAKNFLAKPQSFTPHFSLSLPNSAIAPPASGSAQDLDSQVSKVINSSDHLWSITVSANPAPPLIFNWSKNQDNLLESEISTIYNKLSQLSVTSNSKIKPYLPQGVQIKESYLANPQSIVLQSLVIVPHKQIIIIIRYRHPDTEVFQQQLSSLIPALYWSIIQVTN